MILLLYLYPFIISFTDIICFLDMLTEAVCCPVGKKQTSQSHCIRCSESRLRGTASLANRKRSFAATEESVLIHEIGRAHV